MPHDPSNVTWSEVNISEVDSHDVIHGPFKSNCRPALVPDDTLGRTCSTRCIKDVKVICTFHPFAFDILKLNILNIEGFPLFWAFYLMLRPFVNEDFLLISWQLNCLSEDLNIVYDLVGLKSATGGHNELGFGIDDSPSQLLGCKTSENYRMNSANSGTGPGGKKGLWNHGHVDDDPISLLNSVLP